MSLAATIERHEILSLLHTRPSIPTDTPGPNSLHFRAGVLHDLDMVLSSTFAMVWHIRCRRYALGSKTRIVTSVSSPANTQPSHIVQELLCVPAQFLFTLRTAMDHYGDLAQMAQHFSVSGLASTAVCCKLCRLCPQQMYFFMPPRIMCILCQSVTVEL